MGLTELNFQRNSGGLGAAPPSIAHKTGLAIWADISVGAVRSYPSGYSSSDNIKQYFSPEEAYNDGITGDDPANQDWFDLKYHIDEYFRLHPNGELWVGIFDATAPNWPDVKEIQYEASGELFQIGAFIANQTAYSTTPISNFHSELMDLESENMPAAGLIAMDYSGVSSGSFVTTTNDLTQETSHRVHNVVGQDGGARGADLFANHMSYSLTTLGASLGAVSSLQESVHLSISYPDRINMSDGVELDVPALANGDLVKTYSKNTLDSLKDKHHGFIRKRVLISGTFNEFDHTAVARTNDFSDLPSLRTMDKAVRRVYQSTTPQINGPVYITEDGNIDPGSISLYEGTANEGISVLETDQNVSFARVKIDPDQNTATTNELTLSIQLGKVALATTITVPIKYVAS